MIIECIKGVADSDNINVVCMQGDLLRVVEVAEGGIYCVGTGGWCEEVELNFTPRVFVECFKVKEK